MTSRPSLLLPLVATVALAVSAPVVAPASAAAAPAAGPAATTAAVTAPPSAPLVHAATAFVDGIRLMWGPGQVGSTAPAPTSFVVTRHGAPAGDESWTRPAAPNGGLASMDDTSAPVGVPVTYTVTAVRAGESSDPSSPSDVVTRPSWEGPYEGARTALLMVWDEASALPNVDDARDTVVADSGIVEGLSGSPGHGLDWLHSISPVVGPDGTHPVGTGDGQVAVDARAGTGCGAPTGTVTIARTAHALGGLASQTVDAELDCANGHHLTVAFRWRTPDPLPLVRATGTATATVAPGGTGTARTLVRNDGSSPLEVSGVKLLALGNGAPTGLTLDGSTCASTTLAPGASCTVDVAYAPAAEATQESRALVVLSTPLGEHEVGTVVGQLAGAGQSAPTGTSSPRGLRLTWSPPASLDPWLVKSYRLERQDPGSSAPVVVKTLTSTPWAHDVGTVPTGSYTHRVVLTTTDGRELVSPWGTARVPETWLLMATNSPVVVPVNPEDGWAVGGTFGYASLTSSSRYSSIAANPRRASVVAGYYGSSSAALTEMGPTTSGPAFSFDEFPHWVVRPSPDGTSVVMTLPVVMRGTEVERDGGLAVIDLASRGQTVVPASAGLTFGTWMPDNTALLAIADSTSIVRVDPTTGARKTILVDDGISALGVSTQGRLAYVRSTSTGGNQIIETTLSGAGRRVLATYHAPGAPVYDPTGRYLFVSGGRYSEGGGSRVYDLQPSVPTLVASLPEANDAAWWDPVSSAPVPAAAVPAWTGTAPTVTITASDPDDAPGGLRTECRLDGAVSWVPCAGPWKPGTLAAGGHTLVVRATDPSGQVGERTVRWTVDGTAPVSAVAALPAMTTSTSITPSWSATDAASGVSRFDLRYRRATVGTGLSAYVYPSTLQNTTARTTTLRGSGGDQWCISVRARDVAGNTGAWSAERCTLVPLDDRSLTASRGWTRATSGSYLMGTATRTTTKGATLTRTGVSARRVGLVVTTCSTCGSVDVYVGSTYAGRVSLAATARHRQVRWLPAFSSTRKGTITLRTTSSRTVVVDAVLLSN